MFPALLTCALAAALGQAPAEGAYLKALPADAPVVMHLRSAMGMKDDVEAMLKALSPTVADQAAGPLAMMTDQLSQTFGEKGANTPVIMAMQLPNADDMQSPPPMAVLIKAEDFDTFLKSRAKEGEELKFEKHDGGYESFVDKNGQSIYMYKGDGFHAFGPNEVMVKAIAAKPSETFAGKAKPEVVQLLLAGDLSIYVDLAQVQVKYADQIKEAEGQFMAMLDQAAAQAQGAQMEQAKQLYAALFDGIKIAESVTLSLDFSKEALDLSGLLTVKADSDSAKTLTTAKLGNAEGLASLPATEMAYVYVNFDPAGMEGLMKLNMANITAGQADEALIKKSMEAAKAAGRQESIMAFSLGQPVNVFTITKPEHPEHALDASKVTFEALKSQPMFKNVTVEENVLEVQGFKLSKASMTIDAEKVAEAQGQANEQVNEIMKRFMGEGPMTVYYGSDGKRVVSIMASNEAEVKAKLETALSGGSGGVGATAGYKALRSRLPENVGALVMLNSQEMVKQIANMVGRLTGGEVKTPSMPKGTALLGFAYAATPAGYRFDIVVPTEVGPVFEQGFGALIQSLQGQVGQ